MKYNQIDNALFSLNRANLEKQLPNNVIALFCTNDEFSRSGDQNHLFKQNSDFFYLSGIDQ